MKSSKEIMSRLFFAGVLVTLFTVVEASAFDIVKDGKAVATIVVPGRNKHKDQIKAATDDLVYHVKLMTGAELPVVSEDDIAKGSKVGGNPIYLGESKATRDMGIDKEELPLEGFRIVVKDNVMAIVGKDFGRHVYRRYYHPATWYGVLHLLEKYFGVRWLYPGEDGIYYETGKDLSIKSMDETKHPSFLVRIIRNYFPNGHMERALEETFLEGIEFDYQKMSDEHRKWYRRVRLAQPVKIRTTHQTWFYKEYFKEHPEYFAQQIDGTRKLPGSPSTFKLCVSNPDVAKIMITTGKEFFAKNKAAYTYNIAFTDSDGWCWCTKCKALDAKDQKTRTYPTYPGSIEYPFLTDRYMTMWNKVAEALSEEYPDRFVGILCYGACKAPPVREKVHPNIIIASVTINNLRGKENFIAQSGLEQWFEAGLKSFYWRPNLMYADCVGMPYIYAEDVGNIMKYFARRGMRGFDHDSWNSHFAADGINMYVITRLTWNPNLDPVELMREYCDKSYGRAGKLTYDYFKYCADICDKMNCKGGDKFFRDAHRFYTEEALAHLDTLSRKIEAGSKRDDEQFRKRVKFFMEGHRYTMLMGKSILVMHQKDRLSPEIYWDELYQAVKERENFLENLNSSWSVNAAVLRYKQTVQHYYGIESGYHVYARVKNSPMAGKVPAHKIMLGEAGRISVNAHRTTIEIDGDSSDWKDG